MVLLPQVDVEGAVGERGLAARELDERRVRLGLARVAPPVDGDAGRRLALRVRLVEEGAAVAGGGHRLVKGLHDAVAAVRRLDLVHVVLLQREHVRARAAQLGPRAGQLPEEAWAARVPREARLVAADDVVKDGLREVGREGRA